MSHPEPIAEPRCCLCNVRAPTTVEHVPPRGWFGDHPSENLITVPACTECNHGSHLDDDYMVAFLTAMDVPGASASLDQVRTRVVRGMHRPKFPGLRNRLLSNAEMTVRTDPNTGEREITAVQARPETNGIMNTIRKQTRALVYHLTGKPLSRATFTMLERVWGLQTQPAERWEMWTKASDYALAHAKTRAVGDVFRYTYCEIKQSACAAVLRLEYYSVFPYLVLIFRPEFAPPQRVRCPF